MSWSFADLERSQSLVWPRMQSRYITAAPGTAEFRAQVGLWEVWDSPDSRQPSFVGSADDAVALIAAAREEAQIIRP
jgi:hypothetical protein